MGLYSEILFICTWVVNCSEKVGKFIYGKLFNLKLPKVAL